MLPVVTRPVPSASLAVHLEALRRRQTWVTLGTGLGLTVVIVIELLAVALFVDWWLELPWGFRLISLAAQIGIATVLLGRLVLLPWMRQPDEDELALWVEK